MHKDKLKILIIGSGGREHAVGWKVAKSVKAGQIFFAPGNAGTAKIGVNVGIQANETSKLLDFAKKEKIDMTLALPDDPLALGVVDEFEKVGLQIWGPTRQASRIEWSKAFAKDFMKRNGLPTAGFEIFDDFEKAKLYAKRHTYPLVIKASGLALGKGVVICENFNEAHFTLENIMLKKVFGDAGDTVVIEEFLAGTEISIHALSDGENYKIFPSSQDHKRISEGNTGLNTGGMGVVAPLPFVDQNIMDTIEKEIIEPTLRKMREEGNVFKGILYPSVMLTESGPKIIEFNARFGDPEAQVYMRLLDSDFLEIIEACLDQKLSSMDIKWKSSFACNIALASGGYPENYERGKIISGIDGAEMQPDIVVFHAGTKTNGGELITNGGRVLGVSSMGDTLGETLRKAYKAIEKISFDGMQYRKDIGSEALEIKL